MTPSRLSHLFELLKNSSLDALALAPGPTLRYLCGFRFDLMERPIILLLAPPDVAAMVLPELESGKLAACPLAIRMFTYGDNPATWQAAFHRAFQYLRLDDRRIGVEPSHLRVLELRYMEAAATSTRFISAEAALEPLRLVKDADEVNTLQQSVRIAQQAFLAALPAIKPGVTERQLAAELTIQLLRAGSDVDLPFPPLVASGANAANPHATPSDRRLQ
ncbi:MAG: aminopeptidase P family N-terminal domain-containing protein, partial [Anaerolineaceae bacterium]|nr:aminopeptidase P family N-terminal domain-containing protein [Anaerolineaceae bacterium]